MGRRELTRLALSSSPRRGSRLGLSRRSRKATHRYVSRGRQEMGVGSTGRSKAGRVLSAANLDAMWQVISGCWQHQICRSSEDFGEVVQSDVPRGARAARRSDVVGIFPNDQAAIRLAGALFTRSSSAISSAYPCARTAPSTTSARRGCRSLIPAAERACRLDDAPHVRDFRKQRPVGLRRLGPPGEGDRGRSALGRLQRGHHTVDRWPLYSHPRRCTSCRKRQMYSCSSPRPSPSTCRGASTAR
jgi:hypothetical protein